MFHRKAWRIDAAHKPSVRLRLEELEARITPYATTGNAWPQPEMITISFVPDGTIIGYNQNGAIYSTLQNDFNALFGSPAVWQQQILRAAQSWADATNINFSVVGDNGTEIGTTVGYNEQGDPNIGDIRIAGFQDTGASYLAQAYQPPPVNDYSIAGDIWFNTSQAFNIGSTYDLYTVAAHEIGHALGMDHSQYSNTIMATYYPGTYTGLTTDDIDGIESIYSAGAARSPDAYNVGTKHNNSFANATSFTVSTTTKTAQLTNLDILTVNQNEYFKFVAPTGSSSTLQLSIQSTGLSLLSPRAWVYNSAETQIGYLSGVGQYGDTLDLTVTGIVAGKTYYVKVDGSEADALGTGDYALSLSLGSNPVPTVTLPVTTTPNGNPLTSGGSEAESVGDQYEVKPPAITTPVTTPAPVPIVGLLGGHLTSGDEHTTLALPHVKADQPATHVKVHQASSEDGTDAVVPSVFPVKK